jgi:hypothetical protein
MKPIAYINVEKRRLEFAEPIKWHTPTVANLDRIPLFTKEALAQEQEPVAHWSDCAVHSEPAYPKGECDCGGIVAVADYTALSDKYVALSDKYVALKAQRTWQGLTDKQTTQAIKSMPKGIKGWMIDWDLHDFSKAIEAKLKEKNT